MSQRPYLGSTSSSPGETTYLAKLTGHTATREKFKKVHIKPFSTSRNTLLFITMTPPPTQPEGILNTSLLTVSAIMGHSRPVLV